MEYIFRIYIHFQIATFVYITDIYICPYIRFQKRCNLKINMNYIYLLFSHQEEKLFDEKTNFYQIATFLKTGADTSVCMYVYI